MEIDASGLPRAARRVTSSRVRDMFLGPEIARFSAMAETADQLAAYQRQQR